MIAPTRNSNGVIILTGDSVNSLCVVSLVLVALEPDRPIFSNREIQGRDYYHLCLDTFGRERDKAQALKLLELVRDNSVPLAKDGVLLIPMSFMSELESKLKEG